MTDLIAAPRTLPFHTAALGLLRSPPGRYVLAVVLIALGYGLSALIGADQQHGSPYLLLVPAILIASGIGGLGPGLLATALSVVCGLAGNPDGITRAAITGA